MSVLYKLSSKTRLVSGSIIFVLGMLSFLYIYKYDTGFFEGFITGILIGIGFGLVITYKKKE
ncbi:hypothetical protein [Psychroserpens mesophilus]|uniref:hypothetical protein n=1 Tax=Psychroserpens mesophilus TaxID=325473 RepID=UPI003D65E341